MSENQHAVSWEQRLADEFSRETPLPPSLSPEAIRLRVETGSLRPRRTVTPVRAASIAATAVLCVGLSLFAFGRLFGGGIGGLARGGAASDNAFPAEKAAVADEEEYDSALYYAGDSTAGAVEEPRTDSDGGTSFHITNDTTNPDDSASQRYDGSDTITDGSEKETDAALGSLFEASLSDSTDSGHDEDAAPPQQTIDRFIEVTQQLARHIARAACG